MMPFFMSVFDAIVYNFLTWSRTYQENFKISTAGFETEYDIVFNFVELAKGSAGTTGKSESENEKILFVLV